MDRWATGAGAREGRLVGIAFLGANICWQPGFDYRFITTYLGKGKARLENK